MALHLTPKQLAVLERIRTIRMSKGYSPTMQELADELGISKVTVFEHVEALVRKGALVRRRNKKRSLDVRSEAKLPDEERNTKLPLVGTIAAGCPIEAVEDRQSLDLEEIFAPQVHVPGSNFALRVRGDSMIDEQIREGDYVIVRRQSTAADGQTVVALIDSGEATLKKFFRDQGNVRLQPANEKYQPIVVPFERVQVQGVVVGVIRRYE